jgi:hypothetical protein
MHSSRSSRSFRASLLFAPVLSLALLGACSDDDDDGADDVAEDAQDAAEDAGDAVDEASSDAIETVARNIASAQGEDEFSSADVDVEGDLTCEATVKEQEDAVDIACTGTGTDGQALELTGTTSEIPGESATELEGDFVGTADGSEVFTVDTLGG